MTLHLSIPRRVEHQFKVAAKCAWLDRRTETYALLLGTVAGDQIHCDELWFPEDLVEYCTHDSVNLSQQARWVVEATEYAREEDMAVIGSSHSHPYRHRETGRRLQDRVMSEGDLDAERVGLVSGICTVQEVMRGGKMTLRASMRFWGPSVPLEVELL